MTAAKPLLPGFMSSSPPPPPCSAQLKEFLSDSTVTTNQKNDSSSSLSLQDHPEKAAFFFNLKEASQEEVNKSEENQTNGGLAIITDVLENACGKSKDEANEEGSSENMVSAHLSERIYDGNHDNNNGDGDEDGKMQVLQPPPWKLELGTNPSCFVQKEPSENQIQRSPQAEERSEAMGSYRQGNWLLNEILILLEAKAKEEEDGAVGAGGGESCSRKSRACADDKWKNVSEYCKAKGVCRTKEQCRIKWDNMMPDFRKIRDYEEGRERGAHSYFDMEAWERRAKVLPSNMDMVVYQKIASILSNKPFRERSGGLKREAREKKNALAMAMPSSALQPRPTAAMMMMMMPMCSGDRDRYEESDRDGGQQQQQQQQRRDRDGGDLAERVGRHVSATSSSRKRRRRRRASAMEHHTPGIIPSSSSAAAAACMLMGPSSFSAAKDPPPPTLDIVMATPVKDPAELRHDDADSSTEDDEATMMLMSSCPVPRLALGHSQDHQRVHAQLGSSPYPVAERSSLPSIPQHQCLRLEQPLPMVQRQHHPHQHEHQQQGLFEPAHGSSPFNRTLDEDPRRNRITHDMFSNHVNNNSSATLNGSKSASHPHHLLSLMEERKEARHRELMALEREKLSVFKEASFTIANTMANAMAMFSKVAEELLLRRRL